MRKLCLVLLSSSLLATQSHAAFNGVSHHSRANCFGINESISWDATGYHYWYVQSKHIDWRTNKVIHTLSNSWENSWRNAKVCWTEAWNGGWNVFGAHWMLDRNHNPVLVAKELVFDCSIYDGWWDKNNGP